MKATWIEGDRRWAFGMTGEIEISTAAHAELILGQAQGKVIGKDANGWPVLLDPPAPTLADIQAVRRTCYAQEADPLKFEAEHDAILGGTDPDYTDWLAKVAEIKARHPLPR